MNYFLIFLFIFIVFDLIILFLVIKNRRKSKFSEKDLNFIKINWFRILDLSKTNPEKSIMDADKLLDFALSKRGKEGTLAEKLKTSKNLFNDINSVWSAHKLRNKIAHEFKDLKESEIKFALKAFKRALTDLGVDL